MEYLNGHIVALGKDTGVPTPINTRLCELVREAERAARGHPCLAPEEIADGLDGIDISGASGMLSMLLVALAAAMAVAPLHAMAAAATAVLSRLAWRHRIELAQRAARLCEHLRGMNATTLPPRTLLEYEAAAQRTLRPLGRVYYGYMDDEGSTARATRAAYDSIRLVPRIMRDVSTVDTTVEYFGCRLSMPVLVAPTAFHILADPDGGEVSTARGAGGAGAGYCYNFMLAARPYTQVIQQSGVKWLHMYLFQV